jgi:transcriptional regulator with XRE-family HTH domain
MKTPDNIIRKMRLRAGLTQVELAKRAHVSQGWISELEGNRGHLTTTTVKRLATVCCLHVGYTTKEGWRILPDKFKLPAEKKRRN